MITIDYLKKTLRGFDLHKAFAPLVEASASVVNQSVTNLFDHVVMEFMNTGTVIGSLSIRLGL